MEEKRVVVALDAMGGDFAPAEQVKGAVEAVNENPDVCVKLFGIEEKVNAELSKYTYKKEQIEVIHAPTVIETAEPPVKAIKTKKDSSMVTAMYAVKNGEADAMVSCGSTGALLVGGQVIVGRIRGIERGALAFMVPTLKGMTLIIDCGANVDARADMLVQFAQMGSIYMECMMGIKNPRVGIINIGEEEEKGNALVKETFPLLKECKGINFVGLRDAGDPVELASRYDKERCDELVFLDITASSDNRETIVDVARNCASQVFIPFTVGGGIRTADDMRKMLKAGADKTSVNSAAVKDPDIIRQGAEKFGSQCVVLAIDARKTGEDKWEVFVNGGRTPTGIDCIEWAKKGVALGAGEILLTSMDADGTKDGYDIPLTRAVSETVNVPVIASGGAGKLEHFYDVLTLGKADAVLAASVFHYGQFTVRQVKEYLKSRGVEVRF